MHVVYYVTPDHQKQRVSRAMTWGEAQDRWQRVYPISTAGRPLDKGYYAVRSADDPNWPAAGKYHQARNLKTGRWT